MNTDVTSVHSAARAAVGISKHAHSMVKMVFTLDMILLALKICNF